LRSADDLIRRRSRPDGQGRVYRHRGHARHFRGAPEGRRQLEKYPSWEESSLLVRFARLLLAGASLLAAATPLARPAGYGPTAVLVSGPDVGRQAPEFSLPWANKDGVGPANAPYELWRDRGKTVVIAFFPKDFTSGCTAEMRTFGEQYDSLFGSDVVVVGISADSLTTHVRFASSLNLPFRLLSDPQQKVAGKFGS